MSKCLAKSSTIRTSSNLPLSLQLLMTYLNFSTIYSYNYLWRPTIWHYTLKLLILVNISLILRLCHHHYFQWKCGTTTSWFSMDCQGRIILLRHGIAHLLVTCLVITYLYGVFLLFLIGNRDWLK